MVEPAFPAAERRSAAAHDGRSPQRWFIPALYSLAVIWGVRHIYYWHDSLLDLLVPVAMAVALGVWTIADARDRGHPIPMLARPWFFLLAGFLVPGYVIWSRRGWGVALVLMHLACWYGLCLAVMHVGGWALYGQEWWRAMGLA